MPLIRREITAGGWPQKTQETQKGGFFLLRFLSFLRPLFPDNTVGLWQLNLPWAECESRSDIAYGSGAKRLACHFGNKLRILSGVERLTNGLVSSIGDDWQ